jgi:hypothetical protein
VIPKMAGLSEYQRSCSEPRGPAGTPNEKFRSGAGVESEDAAVIEHGPSASAPPPVMITANLTLTLLLLKSSQVMGADW